MAIQTCWLMLSKKVPQTVKVITEWALSMEGVCAVEAETDPENVTSQNVLRRAGFVKNGVIGEEDPRFVYRGKENENPQSYSFWRKNGFYVISENEYIVMEQLL